MKKTDRPRLTGKQALTAVAIAVAVAVLMMVLSAFPPLSFVYDFLDNHSLGAVGTGLNAAVIGACLHLYCRSLRQGE